MKNIRHSSSQPKWGTPSEVIDIGRAVLTCAGLPDVITVDPFSEPEFNAHVKANHILTGEKGSDGYRDRWLPIDACPRADHILAGLVNPKSWDGTRNARTAIVNPPGSDDGESVKRAWFLLDRYHALGWLGGGALWVAFNLNQLQTLQRATSAVVRRAGDAMPSHPLSPEYEGLRCIPDHRLSFTRHSSNKDGDDAPSHPCFFVLLPSHDATIAAEQRRLFESMASDLGAVF